MLLGAEGDDVLPGLQCRKLCGRAVLVRRADEQRLLAARPLKPRKHIGRQHRADEIAQMLDAVDVWQRAGDEDAALSDPLGRFTGNLPRINCKNGAALNVAT